MTVFEMPVDLVTEIVSQMGAVVVAFLAFLGVVLGALGGRAWERKRNGNGTIRADQIHSELTEGFSATMDAMQALVDEYRRGYEERARRIEELTAELSRVTAELHEVREEVRHLHRVIASHGIVVPPRAAVGGQS